MSNATQPESETDRSRTIRPIEEHPIPTDPEEIERIWEEHTEFDAEDAPHPDYAREDYTRTIAEWGDWHVFRAEYPFGHAQAVILWNRANGEALAIDGDEGRWHELVNLFAEILDEEGDCRDAEYSSSLRQSGAYSQRCEKCGGRWSI